MKGQKLYLFIYAPPVKKSVALKFRWNWLKKTLAARRTVLIEVKPEEIEEVIGSFVSENKACEVFIARGGIFERRTIEAEENG
jgi:hypothetical protein